jgi:hypothetical protein
MSRLCLAVTALALAAAAPAAAGPFAIDLEARAAKARQTAHAQVATPGARPKARDVLQLKAGDRVTVTWKLSNADRRASFKDVTVHLFAVKEEKAGQPGVPKLDRGVVAESALTMDFGLGDKAEGDLSFTIDKPGYYLLRLETIGAAGGGGGESFAALDLTVR